MALTEIFGASLATLSISFLGLTIGSIFLFYIVFVRRPEFPQKAPVTSPGNWPIFGSLGFWTARFDWWIRALSSSPSRNFSFNIGKYQAVGTGSTGGLKQFFENNRELGFAEGYGVLFGQSPNFASEGSDSTIAAFHGNTSQEETSMTDYFSRRIATLLKRQRLGATLPLIVGDVRSRLMELATDPSGISDPFDSIYKTVYLLTIRVVGAVDIANDRKLQERTLELFQTIESTAKPSQIMFPWLPSLALLKRFWAGSQLYMIYQKMVKERQKTGRREDDALQYLIDQGDNMTRIIGFVVGALFAGQLNSGMNAAWVLCYLATSPRWTAEVRKEVERVVEKYHPDSEKSLLDKLSDLPLEAWESEFPMIDLCLRDSIRLQLHGTGFRRNISGKEIDIGNGEVVPKDGFLIFHFGHHHLNPEVFPDPEVWDPARYLPDRSEDKKVPYGFVGWGAGRHPCLGMRFAKLEQNVITAFFVSMFDFQLVDAVSDTVMTEQPPAARNSYQAAGPVSPLKIRYTVRDGVL